MVRYAAVDLLDEIAYLAAVLHWPLDTLLDLEHPDRAHFVAAARALTEHPEDEGGRR
ncbi:hypothetical protein H9657_09830 [Cellulomonas sp. Sa3CUA2]|uniref:Uncharacterized protein n=1 Tax=Cellulomonas avistercoris TaxID=2762242 RepID=A0ABR8QDR2_9CELL|nr:hypothetical protein [Cellulomonas avistercoris]MBD7918572.1 hypothetical protein [Cellulomonas avistercoris]